MRPEVFSDETYRDKYGAGADGAYGFALMAGGRHTISLWMGTPAPAGVGPLHFDSHTALEDGSVGRMDGVTIDCNDERRAEVALWATKQDDTVGWHYLLDENR